MPPLDGSRNLCLVCHDCVPLTLYAHFVVSLLCSLTSLMLLLCFWTFQKSCSRYNQILPEGNAQWFKSHKRLRPDLPAGTISIFNGNVNIFLCTYLRNPHNKREGLPLQAVSGLYNCVECGLQCLGAKGQSLVMCFNLSDLWCFA